MTVIVLDSSSVSPWTVPGDWNNVSNKIELIGEGGNGTNGGASNAGVGGGGGGGGGGGAYAILSNQTLSGTVPFIIGTGGTGTDTDWDSSAGVAKHGLSAGAASVPTGGTHGNGGQAALCVPIIGAQSGGNGGNGGTSASTGGSGGGGGGGAAGKNGAGNVGTAGTNSSAGSGAPQGAGGSGDAGTGGSGGASTGASGGTGTELGGGAGAGGGAAGGHGGNSGSVGVAGGQGGLYGGGGGGGGGGGSGTHAGGTGNPGRGGCIVITYTPATQTLGPTQIASSVNMRAPTLVTSGTQTLGPTKIASSVNMRAPTLVTSGPQTLGPMPIPSSAFLFAPALVLPTVFLGPTPIPSSVVMYPPSAGPAVYPDCWTLYYNAGAGRWILDGGNGTLQLATSRPYRCQADNTFDTILVNATGLPDSAIPAITLWPLSDPNCVCPDVLGPFPIPSSVRMRGPTLVNPPTCCTGLNATAAISSSGGWLNGMSWDVALEHLVGVPTWVSQWIYAPGVVVAPFPADWVWVQIGWTCSRWFLAMGYSAPGYGSTITLLATTPFIVQNLMAPPCSPMSNTGFAAATVVNGAFVNATTPASGAGGVNLTVQGL